MHHGRSDCFLSKHKHTREWGTAPIHRQEILDVSVPHPHTTDMTQSEPYRLVHERTFQALCTLARSVIVINCVSPWVWGEPMRPKMQYGRCSLANRGPRTSSGHCRAACSSHF